MMGRAAIVVFSDCGAETAARLKRILAGSEIYGFEGRVLEVDHSFSSAPAIVQRLNREGREIIGLSATGIIIRALAPVISDKRAEPPVVALSDDGAIAIPLLGGLTGANELARLIAQELDGTTAISASGSRRFGLQLEAPPAGYALANPDAAKAATTRLISGERVRLKGNARFITESRLPFSENGAVPIVITHHTSSPPEGGLLYHPRVVIVVPQTADAGEIDNVRGALHSCGIAEAAVAAIVLKLSEDALGPVRQTARRLGCPIRYIGPRTPSIPSDIEPGVPIVARHRAKNCDLVVLDEPDDVRHVGREEGHLTIVGLGPGSYGFLTNDAQRALFEADHLVGYQTYLDMVPHSRAEQRRHASGNRVELERAREALKLAMRGERVAVVSSGDPGIFAMAAAVMEALETEPRRWRGIEVTTIPGVSAMQAAAARLGAPLGHDFAVISLSDIRKPWSIIEARLVAALTADFVIALYNPASRSRRTHISEAKTLMLRHRSPRTPVVIGRNLARGGEDARIVSLSDLPVDTIDMRTVLIIGSSRTRSFQGPGGELFAYTPRSYDV